MKNWLAWKIQSSGLLPSNGSNRSLGGFSGVSASVAMTRGGVGWDNGLIWVARFSMDEVYSLCLSSCVCLKAVKAAAS